MSALERFVRARRFRARAAEYFELAADEVGLGVRARYLAIADHYTALADHELRSDRLERKKRLEEMRAARDKRGAAARLQSADQKSSRSPLPVKLRVIQGQAGDSRKSSQPPAPSSGSVLARPARRKYSRHAW
jgi:hypothetical protein